MTSHEKKKYLIRYQTADKCINDLIEEKSRIRAMLERTTPTYSMAGGGGNDDKMASGMARLIDIEDKINRKIDELYDMRLVIEAAINELPDDNMKRVLYLRYVLGYRWERVALEMGYEVRQIFRLHGKALYILEIEDVSLSQ